jgi:TIR domain/Pentapeptide repeats (8 copies)
MANPEHLEILKQGVGVWNQWRFADHHVFPDLSNSDLKRKDLSHHNLVGADMSGANLGSADLSNSDCTNANFNNATLKKAILWNVKFHETTFMYTDFTEAHIAYCVFASVTFLAPKGLEKVRYLGPSSIGTDTLENLPGEIPRIFLIAAGVHDEFLKCFDRMASIAKYHSCFISHATENKDFADRLWTDLQNNGVRCWYSPEDLKGGKKVFPQVDQAIRAHNKLILILSESSISSEWVATEIKRTRKYEKEEGRQRLFPISLVSYEGLKQWEQFDADTGTDLAAEVRSYFIPDFSNWKDEDSYKEAFDRLLGDLRAE